MTALVGVTCDGAGCERVYSTSPRGYQVSTTRVRGFVRKVGWHETRGVVQTEDGRTFGYARDICPSCWAKGER